MTSRTLIRVPTVSASEDSVTLICWHKKSVTSDVPPHSAVKAKTTHVVHPR